MYGWHPTVYKVWAYFILANLVPLIIFEYVFVKLFSYIPSNGVGGEPNVTDYIINRSCYKMHF